MIYGVVAPLAIVCCVLNNIKMSEPVRDIFLLVFALIWVQLLIPKFKRTWAASPPAPLIGEGENR